MARSALCLSLLPLPIVLAFGAQHNNWTGYASSRSLKPHERSSDDAFSSKDSDDSENVDLDRNTFGVYSLSTTVHGSRETLNNPVVKRTTPRQVYTTVSMTKYENISSASVFGGRPVFHTGVDRLALIGIPAVPADNQATTKPFLYSTENFTHCIRSRSAFFFGRQKTHHVVSGSFSFYWKEGNYAECSVTISVPETKVIEFQVVDMSLNCEHAMVYIYKTRKTRNTEMHKFCGKNIDPIPKKVYLISNLAIVHLELMSLSTGDFFQLKFSAVEPDIATQLDVYYVTDRKGYMTSPGWTGEPQYLTGLDSLTSLAVPSNHVTMISFVDLDLKCPYGNAERGVSIMAGPDFPGDLIVRFCKDRPQKPILYESDALYIRYVSVTDPWLRRGFRLLFSFHNATSVPQRVAEGGLWNCSVPHWADFQQHLPCNLEWECAGGEDEAACPYTSRQCARGEFRLAGSCYAYVVSRNKSWDTASADCQRRGYHLVSLNDPLEWEAVTQFVLRTKERPLYFTGLRTAPPSAPRFVQGPPTKACFRSHLTLVVGSDTDTTYLRGRLEFMVIDNGYKRTFLWADGSVAYYTDLALTGIVEDCFVVLPGKSSQSRISCIDNGYDYICEKHVDTDVRGNLPAVQPAAFQTKLFSTCPQSHVTHHFLACDLQSACWARVENFAVRCLSPLSPPPPMLTCNNGMQKVPYTLVCDHRPDCGDHSDENFCVFPPCSVTEVECGDGQCIPQAQECDSVEHCYRGVDELNCNARSGKTHADYWESIDIFFGYKLRYGLVEFNGKGNYIVHNHSSPQGDALMPCPPSHFRCPGHAFYCLPLHVRCNSVRDCPLGEDEAGCQTYMCPGLYRCRAAPTCLHPTRLCDGVFHCPQHDDELYCHLHCPPSCTCYGHAFFCPSRVALSAYPRLRFLEGRDSGLTPADVGNNTLLIHLGLTSCGLASFLVPLLNNLQSLDLSDNRITSISTSDLLQVRSLRTLILAGNPLVLHGSSADVILNPLINLDLSRIPNQRELNISFLTLFPHLQVVNLSQSFIDRITDKGFQSLKKLRILDMQGCPVTHFQPDVFRGLAELRFLQVDNFKLCCPAVLPDGFSLSNCQAPSDEISSCDSLLRSDFYRVLLSGFATLALLGNTATLLYRALPTASSKSGFGVFVIHLCVSDLLMGVYMAVIGVVDQLYTGSYLWKDTEWKHSAVCQLAGFLSQLSCEVSALVICLITLDRFLVLRFPFSRQLHFSATSANATSGFVWVVGLVLAAVPLLPVTSDWDYYGQTGICIPLPITRKDFPGKSYSFSIMIGLNFVLFLLIAVGQGFIYSSIQASRMSSADSSVKSKDQTIARRLITIAMADFLCWFPIGVLGLLASRDVAISGEVNVAMAIIVLPLNSVLNPFLYTINLILARRHRAKEARVQRRLLSQLKSGAHSSASQGVDILQLSYSKQDIVALLEKWVSELLLPIDRK